MAILVSLLYGGGGVRCGNQKVIGTFDSLILYGSRYVSEILAAIGLCHYGGMCQIRWLPQVSASMEVCVRYAGCHRPQVSVFVEVCVRHAGCHMSLSLWRYVYYYTVWGGVIYVQVYRQKVNAVRAWGWSDGYTRLITL